MLSAKSQFPSMRSRVLNVACLACLYLPVAALAQGADHADMSAMSPAPEALTAVAKAVGDACQIDVQGRPGKQFSPAHISVPSSCKTLTVQLIHTGKKPKAAAGHNWVLVRADDIQATVADGLAAGAENDWVKPGDDRVIAKTAMIGGGQRTSVTFDVSALSRGTDYTYYCSFPAHAAMMRGALSID
ncbi:azurin [Pandoraea anhela]|uniref:Azurin n=1 Tax=Pandoraea anhela TaxID=2508295 RepID=A0A5E4RUK8_9BURK|nr:azurin [Pandoraea anhela]VVD66481.1 azurin [Pandoraea anhela]